MHSFRILRWFLAPLAATFAAISCKPVGAPEGSATFESGGTTQTWKVKSNVTGTGEITLEKTGTDATADGATITGLELEVSSAPSGELAAASLTQNKLIPLTTGVENSDLKLNVLMTTKGLGLCYVNDVTLTGSTDEAACKDAKAPTAGPNDPLVVELRELCKGFAKLPIDAAKPTEFFASFDEKKNHEKCTCLNGKPRDLFYEIFLVTPTNAKKHFEDSCKKALLATDTSTGTSTAVTYVEFEKTKPGSGAGSGSGSGTGSGSGSGTGSGSGSGSGTGAGTGTGSGSGSASGTTPPVKDVQGEL